jgi:hypothetical protein
MGSKVTLVTLRPSPLSWADSRQINAEGGLSAEIGHKTARTDN